MYVHHDQVVVDRVLALSAKGQPALAIARQVGIDPKTARRWIASHGERVTKSPRCTPSRCVVRDDADPATYAYVFGLYLGDGHIVRARNTWRLEIACDPTYCGIIDDCALALGALLPQNQIARRVRPQVVNVGCYSNHLPCLFPQHGVGPKHSRPIVLEPWQRTIVIQQQPGPFLRGLIQSDGWRGINRVVDRRGVRREYPRYMFTNRSSDIRGLFVAACEELGVHARQSNAYNLSVADKSGVCLLDHFVGPKH